MVTRKYTKEILQPLVESSNSINEILRKLGFNSWSGATHQIISKRIIEYGLDSSHFSGLSANKGKASPKRLSALEVFQSTRPRERRSVLLRALLEIGRPYLCVVCGQKPEWQGKRLILQIDHIDGNSSNNSDKNLRFLCPNCHSQTTTFGTLNKRQ